MQAIQTKFIGPTNTKGSRIKAACWLTSITVEWDYALSSEANHEETIVALVEKLNREREFGESRWYVKAIGSSVDGEGYTAIIDLK